MSISKQIEELLAKRNAKLKAAEEMLTKSDAALDDAEQEKFDGITAEVQALELKLANLEKLEASQAKKFKGLAPTVITNMKSQGKGGQREKGVFFARMAHALYVNDGNRAAAAEYVKSTFDDREMHSVLSLTDKQISKAATAEANTSVPEWAGALTVIREASEEFIDMLRPMSIMARIGGRRMNFDGANQIKIPRNSGGIPAGQNPGEPLGGNYVGEAKAIPVKQGQFDNVILTPKKIAVITASSTENLERSSPSLEMLLRDDMLADTALVVDTKFNSSDAATAIAPGGIYNGITAITPAALGDTTANMVEDLKNLFGALRANNCSMSGLTLIMDPNNYNALMFAQTTQGVYLFRDELSGGTLFGAQVLYSNTVQGQFCSLVDANQILIAEDQAPTIDVSEEAALEMSTTPSDDLATPTDGIVRSLWQSDMAAIRLRWRHDWVKRLDQCTAYTVGTNWVTVAAP